MNRRSLFQKYADQRSRCVPPGFHKDAVEGITRWSPVGGEGERGGMVLFSRLPAERVDAVVAEQIAWFAGRNQEFEWKVHDFDEPPDLGERLSAVGFTREETEAFMLYPVQSHRPRPVAVEGIAVMRIGTQEELRGVMALQETIWQRDLRWLGDYLWQARAHLAMYAAYANDADATLPIGAGWIEFLPGTEFAELHGGSVLPGYRGRGVYSALFEARVAMAERMDVRYVAVDAAPMSRPILLKKGFQLICETTAYRMKQPHGDGASR